MRRRREGMTNYHQRLALLKSGTSRLAVRVSNKYISAQLINLGPIGDETVVSVSSKDLLGYGWNAPTNNIPASYLTGFLLGKKALATGVKEAVLDIGLHSGTKGSKAFAAHKGAIDAGLESPHSEVAFGSWERIRGEHIAEFAEKTKNKLSKDFDLTTLPIHFDEILENLKEASL
tara:strand:+ start:594 stop:1118 length:525 start_codon:yes stop_codon:yes gene_type:complete